MSNIITLPKEIDYITENKLIPFVKDYMENIKLKKYYIINQLSYFTPNKLKNLYKINNTKISVALYNCSNFCSAYFLNEKKLIALNLMDIKISYIKETIRHELIHAVDIKVNSKEINDKINLKHGKEKYFTDRFIKMNNEKFNFNHVQFLRNQYFKQPCEFDAHSSVLINNITEILKNFNEKEQKEYRKIIWNIILEISTNDTSTVFNKYCSHNEMVKMFSDFEYNLEALKAFSTKPSLYRRFKNRLARNIGYEI